jgi:hypothetical protein
MCCPNSATQVFLEVDRASFPPGTKKKKNQKKKINKFNNEIKINTIKPV